MKPRFTIDDAQRAADEWGANCGPSALAVVMGMTLDEVRPHMGDFERKRYTNPTLMFDALKSVGARWQRGDHERQRWPRYGLVRVQWEGPWTAPGVPIRVRYRHTHWVAGKVDGVQYLVFDINCMCVGGWVPSAEWRAGVVPWLLREVEPKSDGRWHLTHVLEIEPAQVVVGD